VAKNNRDEFTEKTKLQIAKRAGWLCSDPSCRRPTVGANSDGDGEVNLGTAAHICAAAPEGPRYDPKQTRAQRRSPDNGIWMCRLHGTAVDAKDSMYTVELLHEWKASAQKDSWRRVLYNDVPLDSSIQVPKATEVELNARLRAAAAADLDVFRRSDKWPSTAIALTLEVEGLNDPVSTSALAVALTTLDDLILVAPPGMGKTTTLFQIAEAVLANGTASPIVVPLGDWSTDGLSLLESVVKRPAFRGISEDDLRAIAAKPGVILLLDGWNELDSAAHRRATAQVARLQAELPELSLLISTRKQALDVPVNGTHINLLPLDEAQQLDIAEALRGAAGARLLDQAWRTAGVRELVTIPLYLTALLALPEGARFPTTKEEVLRCFVAVHEEDTQGTEALADVTHGLHQRFLEDLAVTAMRAANTTIADSAARKSVSETEDELAAERQITEKPQPNAVLAALVSHHVLTRAGDTAGYSFPHQQFQEWYASHFVERLMLASAGVPASYDKLKADVLNQPIWEEAVLFACERMARGDRNQQAACAGAILAAFEVDPMLAAEMIFRSNDTVWARASSVIHGSIERWHTPGRVDRALRFMINSGRPEFFDEVWPLITHENDQVHLAALRAGRRFRPSLLGRDAAERIAALPPKTRGTVLHEIASYSGMDGLDLAAAIAQSDPDAEVKASVVQALEFRRADRHIAEVLRDADDQTFDLVVHTGFDGDVADKHVTEGLDAARARQQATGVSAYDRLRTIVYAQGDLSAELSQIIAEMQIETTQDANIHLIYEMRGRHLRAIADGLLQRVRAARPLFYGADDLLASAGISLEDNALLAIALSETGRRDDHAEAAASVLGPQTVGHMIEALLDVKRRLRDANGRYDRAAGDRYHTLEHRIGHTRGASLVAAIHARSTQAGNEEMADFADLISRHPHGEADRGRPFDAAALIAIHALAENWGTRMLASDDATRWQLASIATLVSHAPSPALLPLLKILLDEELRRFRAFRKEAAAAGWRESPAANEARTLHTHQYQRAFLAINAPETTALMRDYLADEHFGPLAALVMATQWIAANEPGDEKRFRGRVDYSRVEQKRAARTADPAATSPEAEVIFTAVAPLIADNATDDQKKLAVALGSVAARLPHGQRDAIVQKLLSVAPRGARAVLLQNLILSGETIDIEVVKNGLAEVLEAAKDKPWILADGYELKDWLRLLPFVNRPGEAFFVVRSLPEAQRRPDFLEDMISTLATAPGDDAESVLFQLAEADPKLYSEHAWRDAVMRRGTLTAARRLVDLATNGVLVGERTDLSHLARQIGGLIGEHHELREHVYDLLNAGPMSPGRALLARAIAEDPDAEGLLRKRRSQATALSSVRSA
jgi:hypothetical protein